MIGAGFVGTGCVKWKSAPLARRRAGQSRSLWEGAANVEDRFVQDVVAEHHRGDGQLRPAERADHQGAEGGEHQEEGGGCRGGEGGGAEEAGGEEGEEQEVERGEGGTEESGEERLFLK